MKRNSEKKKGQRKKTIMFYIKEIPSRQINHCKGQKLIKMGLGFSKLKKIKP
jgi:hypothetical protein